MNVHTLIHFQGMRDFFTQLGLLPGVRKMINAITKKVYKAFGLRVLSEVSLPELPESEGHDLVDAVIETADLTHNWSQFARQGQNIVLMKELIMFRIPSLAIFCIKKGKEITVCPVEGFDEELLRMLLLGTCMGALLMQRRILPLHGSAVVISGKAYGFVGDSGAGKSTLASAFISRGYKLLSDDVIALSISQENIPIIVPSYPQQKLWQESLKELGMEADRYRPIYLRENKFAVPVYENFYDQPLPLAGLFELVTTENEKIEVRQIERLESLHILFRHTYRNSFIPEADLMEWHFNVSTSIVSRIGFFRLSRPNTGFSAPYLVSEILNTLNQED